ncbi:MULTISPECIES: ABC transporter permease [Alphaproteobacteria]|uniref:ABC transporter permease n=2 Tax=Alphaproteobacteria TaxID=28211 RepID=A0A512HDE7_9HYPH|nr:MULTISPECIES: ABC transporter permease [Alphaproteobacteria]GEO83477.1 ABC transporter permease [Ciceribacter naphthalenivorans]GLR24372.1 ABC transporter permease [Ciceribacter naphthalenivorans]GLT07228.1 ABC transporter permease [Sphingomonas psychrolutea]
MNLAYRDVRHSLFRFVLTCLGLSLLMAVVLAMMGIYNGAVIDALTIARAPKVDIWVVEADTNGPFAESSRVPGATREAVARLHGVAEAGSVTYQNADGVYNGMSRRLYIIGYEPSRLGGPQDLVAGRPITRTHFELIADMRTGLALGDRVRLGRNYFNVVGLVRNHVNSGGDPAVYISLLDAQTLQFEIDPAAVRVKRAKGEVSENQDSVNAVIARLQPDADPEQVTETVRRWKHLSGLTQAQEETFLTRSVVDRQRRQLGLFMAILMVVSAVVIALIIYMMTMEKLKQIATLKLIGAPDRTIIGLIVQQALALGATGWFFGLGMLYLIKDFFPRRVVLDAQDALLLAGIIGVVCLAASGLGIRAALKADPATALGG